MTALITIENMIIALASLGGFASVCVVLLPFMKRDPRASRLKQVAQRRQELSLQQREDIAQKSARQRPSARVNLMKKVMERFQLQKMIASPALKQKLSSAGWHQQSAIIKFVFARFATMGGFALFTFIIVTFGQNIDLTFGSRMLSIAAAGAAGFYLPGILVANKGQKRQEDMTSSFPDTLDLLVICVEAGLSIEAAFSRVTEEISEGSPTLSQELGLTSAELAFLGDRTKAYNNFADRTGITAAQSLATTLIQSEKYGTPVGQALQVLAQENRDDRMAKAEKKAGALPAKLTVPMIVFFLPVLFLVIIGPAIIQMMAM